MSGDAIDFWVSIGSTYSFLTVMRLDGVAAATGVSFRWLPFSVREIMIEQNNIPFRDKPVKLAYMWRDIERRAQRYGMSARVPAPYPLAQFDLANRIAILGQAEGWGPSYIKAAYRRWFQEGQEAGSEPNVSESLRDIGLDPKRVVAKARSAAVASDYNAATATAKSLGVFGSPTFAVDGEVFWGDDRLDDAIGWLRHRRLGARVIENGDPSPLPASLRGEVG